MTPFRERNPVIIGLLGFAVLAALLVGSFRADRLPLIGGGDTYYANFAEAGGLKTGNEVRVAGVVVGKVMGIELAGDHVQVELLVDSDVELGRDSAAAIQVRTLLGAMYVALEPAGPGELEEPIPVSRTVSPYDVVQAFSDLSETTEQLDKEQLAAALDELAQIGRTVPEEFRGAIDGLSRVSQNLAARDQQINDLLVGLDRAMTVLNDKDEQLEKLFTDAQVLFDALASRRDSIRDLLIGTQQLSAQLRGTIKDNEEEIRPTLRNLTKVTTMLGDIEGSLDEMLRLAGPFARVFANTLGNGPWFETNLQADLPPGDQILGGLSLGRSAVAASPVTTEVADGLDELLGELGGGAGR